MLVSRLLVLSVVANANLKVLKRPTGLPLINMQNVTTKLYHLLTPKPNMEKLPEVHHSEGIHLDVFPKLHEFSRGYLNRKGQLDKPSCSGDIATAARLLINLQGPTAREVPGGVCAWGRVGQRFPTENTGLGSRGFCKPVFLLKWFTMEISSEFFKTLLGLGESLSHHWVIFRSRTGVCRSRTVQVT